MNKLKGKLVENSLTYEECAKYLGITKVTFVKKMNNQTQFTIREARELSKLLNLTDEEKVRYFF